MQEVICQEDLSVTDGKLNNAKVRQKLNLVYKNILQRQNPFEIVLKIF